MADVFGYHALQLGLPALQGLRANRMPARWLLTGQEEEASRASPPSRSVLQDDDEASIPKSSIGGVPMAATLCADFHQLPFPANSLDLVVMPHTLEAAADPHQTLREVERVLRPEGRIVVTGFNPASLWGAARRFSGLRSKVSGRSGAAAALEPDWVGYWRLRDWLRLLSFEVEGGRFGCYIPPVSSQRWRDRMAWMEPLGDRWWPVLGSVYALVAVKRVRGMRMVGLAKRSPRVASSSPAIVTQRHPRNLPRSGDGA